MLLLTAKGFVGLAKSTMKPVLNGNGGSSLNGIYCLTDSGECFMKRFFV